MDIGWQSFQLNVSVGLHRNFLVEFRRVSKRKIQNVVRSDLVPGVALVKFRATGVRGRSSLRDCGGGSRRSRLGLLRLLGRLRLLRLVLLLQLPCTDPS